MPDDPWLPERTAALLRVQEAETKILAAVRAFMSTYLAAARRHLDVEAITAAGPPNPDDVGHAEVELTAAFEASVVPAIQEVFGEAFGRAARDAQFSSQAQREAFALHGARRIAGLTASVRDAVARAVHMGISQGQSPGEIALSVRTVLGDDQWANRAMVIARTETMAAVNGGTMAGMRTRAAALGQVTQKRWLCTHDNRTRPDHAVADGQTVPLDGQFVVGGAHLDFPGDPDAPVEQIAQCRCCMLEVTDDTTTNPATGRSVTASGSTLSTDLAEGDPVSAPVVPDIPAAPPADLPNPGKPFNAIIAVEGSVSGDGRMFARGALIWRDLPLPLTAYQHNDFGQYGIPVGRIDAITRDGDLIRATGVFMDAVDDKSREAMTLVENGAMTGISVEVDDTTVEIPDGDLLIPLLGDEGIMLEDLAEGDPPAPTEPNPESDAAVFTAARIMAATIVTTPALPQCHIAVGTEPVDAKGDPTALPVEPGSDAGTAGVAAAAPPPPPPAEKAPVDKVTKKDGTEIGVGDKVTVGEDDGTVSAVDVENSTVDVELDSGDKKAGVDVEDVTPKADDSAPADAPTDPNAAAIAQINAQMATLSNLVSAVRELTGRPIELTLDGKVLAATKRRETPVAVQASAATLLAAGPKTPPSQWFEDPQLDGPTGLLVDDDGRVYGHLALWDSCHTGVANACVMPPRTQSNYGYFHVGETLCDDGKRVATGRITLAGGHATPNLGMVAALAHYDKAEACVADVCAGEDAYGIWVAGAARSTLSDEEMRAFRAAPLSGDWRRVNGNLELMGALCVNLPGYPVPRTQFAHRRGVQTSLVAAGMLPRNARTMTAGGMSAAEVAQHVALVMGRTRRAEQLAASIQRDRRSRAAALHAEVHG